jgi:hypothetical protein
MKVHYATVDEATESDNTTWVYIACDPGDQFVNKLSYSKWWAGVTCKNCLRCAPTNAFIGGPRRDEPRRTRRP